MTVRNGEVAVIKAKTKRKTKRVRLKAATMAAKAVVATRSQVNQLPRVRRHSAGKRKWKNKSRRNSLRLPFSIAGLI